MANIPITVNPGQTKTITFECANTYTPEDIVFTIDGGTTGTELSGIAYSNTGASTAAKTATFPGFALETNQRIILYLGTSSTIANATLNVNSTGAKPIKINSSPTTTSNFTSGYWMCHYDGTNWNAIEIKPTPKDHAHGNITNGGGITGSSVNIANGDSLVIVDSSDSNKVVKSITFDGSTTGKYLSQKGTWVDAPTNTDEKVTPKALASGTTNYPILVTPNASTPTTNGQPNYNATASVNGNGYITAAGYKVGSSNGFLKADGTVDNSSYNNYSHPTYTSHSATGGVSGTTVTIPVITNDGEGHVSDLSSNTFDFKTAPSSTNKVLTESDISGITGAMVYKGTLSKSGSSLSPNPSTSTVSKGDVYVVSANFELTSATNFIGKSVPVGKYEAGDMFIYNGTSWNIVSGENQVTNSAATMTAGASSATTLATVDGTDITAKVSVTAGSATIASVASDVVTLKSGVTQGSGTGTISNSTGSDITLAKVAKTGSYNDLSNLPTIPSAANNAKLNMKRDSATAVQVFSADESTDKTINVIAGTNISLTQDTTTANTYKLTINHASPTGAAQTSSGFYKIATDSQGHVTGTTAVQASDITSLVTIPTVNSGKLKIQANSGTATEIFNANTSSDATIKFANGTNTTVSTSTSSGVTTVTINATDNNTDTLVNQKQLLSSETGNYPILSSSWTKTEWSDNGASSTQALESKWWDAIYMNSSGEIHASKFIVGTTAAGSGEIMLSDGSTIPQNTYALPSSVPAAANNATLKLKGQYTTGTTSDTSGNALFTANASSESTLTITGSNGIKTNRSTNTITVAHTNSVTADSTGSFVKLKYDSQGHITGTATISSSDITGIIGTIPSAANNATLSLKKDTSSAVQIFSANESTNKTLNIVSGTNVTLTEDTSTANTYKLTIAHTTPSGATTKSSGFYKFSTDSQGHVNGTNAVAWSDITSLTGYTDSDEKVSLSPNAVDSSSYKILLEPSTDPGRANWVEGFTYDAANNNLFLGDGSQVLTTSNTTIPSAANSANLTLKGEYTSGTTADSSGATVFNSNESNAKTLTITGNNGIKTYRTAGTNLQTITVEHTNSVTGGASTKGSATKVPQITYDAQGHITSVSEVTITQPTVNNATLTISGDSNCITTTGSKSGGASTFNANDSTANTITISHNTSGVTAGTYNEVTVDDYGHVTSGNNVHIPQILYGQNAPDPSVGVDGDMYIQIQ